MIKVCNLLYKPLLYILPQFFVNRDKSFSLNICINISAIFCSMFIMNLFEINIYIYIYPVKTSVDLGIRFLNGY